MAQTHTLQSFGMLFANMAIALPRATHTAMEAACVVVEREARRVIGTYDYGWPQLAPSTQADRVQQGFPANEPLLRTGEMRDSIEHVSSPTEGRIGSNNPKAIWHELGTSRVPPRPFLSSALQHEAAHVVAIIGGTVHGYLETRSMRAISPNWYRAPAAPANPIQRVI